MGAPGLGKGASVSITLCYGNLNKSFTCTQRPCDETFATPLRLDLLLTQDRLSSSGVSCSYFEVCHDHTIVPLSSVHYHKLGLYFYVVKGEFYDEQFIAELE